MDRFPPAYAPNALRPALEPPRLARFIRGNVEPILAEWETFARGGPTTLLKQLVAT
jgi:hypothetical protein